MGRELTPAELRELLPIYALDALDDDERVEIEQFLDRTPAAREELAALREVTSLLAQPDHEAPADLWARIEEALGAEPPALDLVAEAPRAVPRNGARWRRRALVAVAVCTIAGLGVTVGILSRDMSEQEDRLSELAQRVDGSRRDDLLAMVADPHARTIELAGDDGSRAASIVAMPDGQAYLMGDDLPRLGTDRTYQLWAMTGDATAPTLVSTGVFGRTPGIAAFRAPGAASGFVLTDEHAPGVPVSEGRVVAEGRFDPGSATGDH